jgi:hypothetical protein
MEKKRHFEQADPLQSENWVEDIPPQVFQDESEWHDQVYREVIVADNPELAEKLKKVRKLARSLKSKKNKDG